jgi:RimJ/RimL family protein N-acetyltransferase
VSDLAFIRTARLVLRPYQRADAPMLKEAVDGSLPELVQWLPWAVQEPTPVDILAERLDRFRNAFDDGSDRIYGIFDQTETRVLGGTGLHPRVGAGAVEIGYWVRTDATGQGIAREATAALVTVAFEVLRVERVVIRLDPNNARSRAIPKRLGFVHTTTLEGDTQTPSGAPRDTEVWTLPAPRR